MKIISFCLWGDNPKYTEGAIKNAQLASEIYPGWKCRFYVGQSVPSIVLMRLEMNENTEVEYKLKIDELSNINQHLHKEVERLNNENDNLNELSSIADENNQFVESNAVKCKCNDGFRATTYSTDLINYTVLSRCTLCDRGQKPSSDSSTCESCPDGKIGGQIGGTWNRSNYNQTCSSNTFTDIVSNPIKDINDQIEKCKSIGNESSVDVTETCNLLIDKLYKTKIEIYENLTAWQRVQLSRHPSRPYTLDYFCALAEDTFLELHGDRNVRDDKAMIGGLGKIEKQTFMFIGTQKGYNTKTRQYRNFGMANPEGYRKALRLMKSAEKFNIPIVTFIDTPGAFPGLEAEERGQGEAIARNIYEMMSLKVPIISIIIGEGASGGALGIGVGDKVFMLENTWYSVISPESCSSILWRSWEHKESAAEALKLTPSDMLGLKLIDKIIKEPLGGAHYDRPKTFQSVKKELLTAFKELKNIPPEQLIHTRREKFIAMGTFEG